MKISFHGADRGVTGSCHLVECAGRLVLVDEGVVDDEDRELFWFADTAEETWQGILQWHEANGSPLLRTGARR